MIPTKNILSLLVLLCLVASSCTNVQYATRVVFRNVPSTKDHKKFPKKTIQKADTPYYFEEGTKSEEAVIEERLKDAFEVDNIDDYLRKMKTSAFIVITDNKIVFERYYNKHSRASMQTSFSIAKSVTSLLIGKAIAEGKINSIEDPITNYLPELLERDANFQEVSIQDLLLMCEKICHRQIWDGLKSYYYPDLESLVLNKLHLISSCKHDSHWYNNYHTILLGLILKRTTGVDASKYFEQHIWSKIGTEADASWSTDKKGFPMMAAGINARAIDFAKIGKLVLDNGDWEKESVIDKEWIHKTTQILTERYYNYHWFNSENINSEKQLVDFYAQGVWGQILYISPSLNTIILRQGKSKGSINDEFSGDTWGARITSVAEELHKYSEELTSTKK